MRIFCVHARIYTHIHRDCPTRERVRWLAGARPVPVQGGVKADRHKNRGARTLGAELCTSLGVVLGRAGALFQVAEFVQLSPPPIMHVSMDCASPEPLSQRPPAPTRRGSRPHAERACSHRPCPRSRGRTCARIARTQHPGAPEALAPAPSPATRVLRTPTHPRTDSAEQTHAPSRPITASSRSPAFAGAGRP